MKSCRECVHGVQISQKLIRCDFPLPIWLNRELLSPMVGGELADHMNADYFGHHECPTYQPREERESNP